MTIELRNSDRLPAPAGFSHAAIAPPGQTVYLAGTIGTDAEGNFADGLADQTTRALINMVDALIGVGGAVKDLAKIVVYVVGWRINAARTVRRDRRSRSSQPVAADPDHTRGCPVAVPRRGTYRG